MIKSVARIVTRPTYRDDGKGDVGCDIIIGGVYESANELLKPNTVYEIREVMGELMLVELGESVVLKHREEREIDSFTNMTWHSSYENLFQSLGRHMLLTRKEGEQIMRKGL